MAPKRPLIVIAAEREAGAVLAGLGGILGKAPSPWERFAARDDSDSLSRAPIDIVLSGIGEANAAGAAARVFDPARHGLLVSAGVAGALPGSGLTIGDAVAAEVSIPEVGLHTPEGFVTAAQLGFPLGGFSDPGVRADQGWLERAKAAGAVIRPVLTVAVGSGTDAMAAERADRTGAAAEAMEGAAVGITADRLGSPFLELRVISNTTGDRGRQVWDLERALASLSRLIGAVFGGDG